MVLHREVYSVALKLFKVAQQNKIKIVTAESCTGGLVASSIIDVPGSSKIFDRGFVTYSNEAKLELLNVEHDALEIHGAVSAEIAEQMARGSLLNSSADIAISTTGIAGPGGATDKKPVGLVYFGLCKKDKNGDFIINTFREVFLGDRKSIRFSAVQKALSLLIEFI